MAWKSSFRQNYRTTFSPTVPTSAAGISHVVADVEAPGGEKWEHLKSGGKQWQATPKNLPRMQRTRAIPVAWLNSGLCPDRPEGWIPTTRSAQHVSSYLLPIIRSVRPRFLQHMVSCCGGQGDVERQRGTMCTRSWWWAKYFPKHVELILQINKSLLHLVGSSVLLYLIDDARSNKNQV